jgi:hypothetical protein
LESFCSEAVVDGIEVNITEVFVGDDLVSFDKVSMSKLERLKITYNGKEEIIDRINSTLRDLTIDCPE